MDRLDALLADWRSRALALEAQAAHVVIGQAQAIRLINTAEFARGHVLLQGDVGVGKTTLLRLVNRSTMPWVWGWRGGHDRCSMPSSTQRLSK